ncbi:unnamed protein product [Absidia cylindrospora]
MAHDKLTQMQRNTTYQTLTPVPTFVFLPLIRRSSSDNDNDGPVHESTSRSAGQCDDDEKWKELMPKLVNAAHYQEIQCYYLTRVAERQLSLCSCHGDSQPEVLLKKYHLLGLFGDARNILFASFDGFSKLLVTRIYDGKRLPTSFRNSHYRYLMMMNGVEKVIAGDDDGCLACDPADDESHQGVDSGKVQCTSVYSAANGSAKSSIKYDITGLFGSACARHGIPEFFVDITTVGERFRYAMTVVSAIINKYQYTAGDKVTMMYDIGCKLKKQVDAKYGDSVDVQLALGIFHAYGHSLACQMKYSPRFISGFGLTDGEWMERLWSYLGGFTKVTLDSGLKYFEESWM